MRVQVMSGLYWSGPVRSVNLTGPQNPVRSSPKNRSNMFCIDLGSKMMSGRAGRRLKRFLDVVRFVLVEYGPVASHGDPFCDICVAKCGSIRSGPALKSGPSLLIRFPKNGPARYFPSLKSIQISWITSAEQVLETIEHFQIFRT